jgi:uncharacterized membrane protein YhaH (DUF805 family)
MRLGRAAFWRLTALNLGVATLLVALLPAAFSLSRPGLPPLPLWPVIMLHLCLPIGWLGAQRLHDVGRRGWHAWLPLVAFACVEIVPSAILPLLPLLALWVQNTQLPSSITEISKAVIIATWLGALLLAAGALRTVFLWLMPGDAGDNRYGPPPLDTNPAVPGPRLEGRFLTGRMQRLPFWLIMLGNIALVYGVKYALANWAGGSRLGLLSWISALLYLPSFAAAMLRLHDRNQSGVLAILVFAVNAAAPVLEPFLDHSQINWMNIAIDILSIYLLFQCLQPGDPDENRYGPAGGTAPLPAPAREIAAPARQVKAAAKSMKPDARQGFGRRGI